MTRLESEQMMLAVLDVISEDDSLYDTVVDRLMENGVEYPERCLCELQDLLDDQERLGAED